MTSDVDLCALAGRINEQHRAAEAASRSFLEHARQAGELLLQGQDQCQRQGLPWLKWLGKNASFSQQTASRYMRLARNWDQERAELLTVSNLGLVGALKAMARGDAGDPGPEPLPGGCTVRD